VGYDPVFGARPLKRAIQSEIENPLAQSILAGQFASGDVVQITGSEYGLKFEPIKYH
jgi:ATP-dependent Clp protease ATP-binding subunit ClpB